MSGNRDYIFVLWGKGFDEIAAAIFVAELRRHCLRVKVVGIGGAKLPGACGLALVPDMMLDEALRLVKQAQCVIVPCDVWRTKLLTNDPRLTVFFRQSAENQALFVREEQDEETSYPQGIGAFVNTNQIRYIREHDLSAVVNHIAEILSAKSK